MSIEITLVILLLVAFFVAWHSMRDFDVPHEVHHLVTSRKLKGTIVFFKDKTTHYKH